MAEEQSPSSSSPLLPSNSNYKSSHCQTLSRFIILILLPLIISLSLYQPKDFNPAPLSYEVPTEYDQILETTERIGDGFLEGPEDLAYDSETGYLYTGCDGGWIKRVNLANDGEFKVENWVEISERGRPLGVVFGLKNELIVADAYEGLLKINPDKTIELLTDEAEGTKFKLTDGVDVAKDGTIYFTDASYKYNLENFMVDFLESRPHGRLMSFEPLTNKTTVLVKDLYFANGVSVAPDQNFVIYCESIMRRCKRYHIQGEKKGTVENFIENLPGFPDNIRYDGEDHYWIAFFSRRTAMWDAIFKYPILRKILYILEQFKMVPNVMKDSGVMSVTLDGQLDALYSDPALILTTSGLKIGKHLYYGSLYKYYISRIDLTKIAASNDELYILSTLTPILSHVNGGDKSPTRSIFILTIFIPILASIIILHLHEFDPALLPENHSFAPSITIPVHVNQILALTERIGEGQLTVPEDFAYDKNNESLYIGCEDGWLRKIHLRGDQRLEVEDVIQLDGRPVGIAVAPDGNLFIALDHKGLLKINLGKTIELLTEEAEGIKFGMTDGVDVAKDGTVYFTDASHKYNLENYMLDILEGRPHGRLMSFNPSTNQTTVLVHDLYCANGVSVAPDQNSIIYCETVLRRCKRYHIQGEKKGTVENFIENLPGFPVNIRYDGEDHYWIAFSAARTGTWDAMFKYPTIRKILYILDQYLTVPTSMKDSGMLSVNLDGRPVALYSDTALILTTNGVKIGNHLYYASMYQSYIGRIDLKKIESTLDE